MTKTSDNRALDRKGVAITLLLSLALSAGIIATFLLANNSRNLHRLLQKYRIELKADGAKSPSQPVEAKRAPESEIYLIPKRLMDPRLQGYNYSFSRAGAFQTTDFCKIANHVLGRPLLAWRKSEIWAREADCSGDFTPSDTVDSNSHNSLFIQARGLISGEVSTFRMKLILEPGEQSKPYLQKFVAISEEIFRQNRWQDFNDLIQKIQLLEPFNENHFGISLTLTKEFTVDNTYDLIMRTDYQPDKNEALPGYLDYKLSPVLPTALKINPS